MESKDKCWQRARSLALKGLAPWLAGPQVSQPEIGVGRKVPLEDPCWRVEADRSPRFSCRRGAAGS